MQRSNMQLVFSLYFCLSFCFLFIFLPFPLPPFFGEESVCYTCMKASNFYSNLCFIGEAVNAGGSLTL
jgi:hypothetical protein